MSGRQKNEHTLGCVVRANRMLLRFTSDDDLGQDEFFFFFFLIKKAVTSTKREETEQDVRYIICNTDTYQLIARARIESEYVWRVMCDVLTCDVCIRLLMLN